MEGDGSDRKPGLIIAKHMKDDGSYVFAWCSGVGPFLVMYHRGHGATKDALVVGQWYSFRLAVHDKRDDQLVAFADEAIPIKAIWPASVKNVTTAGRQTAQVSKVPVLVGAVQKTAGVAVAWSPFFQRIGFEQLKLFNLDQVKTGAKLSLTIQHKLLDDDCRWAAISIDEQLASTGLEMQTMGVKKVIAEFATFDASKELCWASGENGEKICFGACDFDRQEQQQNNAVEFRPGDRFLAWIDERSPMVAYHRAFFVQLLSSAPMSLTSKGHQKQQQQKDTVEVRLPTSISPSVSALPSIPIASSSSTLVSSDDFSAAGNHTHRQKLKEQWAKTEEAKGSDEQQKQEQEEEASEEQFLSGGRQLYARIMRQPHICNAICQHDPAILSDLFALFNP